MHLPFQLEDYLADRDPARPIIEAPLALPHPALVAARVHADVRGDPRVEPELHASKPPPYRVLCDLELGGADAAVVVPHPQPIVAPDDCRAAHAASRGHARTAFAGLLGLAAFRHEPIATGGGSREGAD